MHLVWEGPRILLYFSFVHAHSFSLGIDSNFSFELGFCPLKQKKILTCAVVSFRIQTLASSEVWSENQIECSSEAQ
jgi:hypothetical protein